MGRPQRRTPSRPSALPSGESFFVVMLVCSLLLHLATGVILLRRPLPRFPHSPATISVDLVSAPPVAHPQRGSSVPPRPSAASVAPPVKAADPVRVEKELVVPAGKGFKQVLASGSEVDESIAAMRRRQMEQKELQGAQEAIAALKKKKAVPVPQAAAVGSATGSGSEAGSAIGEWLKGEVHDNWIWTDRKRLDLSAEVEVQFNAEGILTGYRFIRNSGNAFFDKSLQNALIKLKALPKPLRKPFTETIIFNLDDLLRP